MLFSDLKWQKFLKSDDCKGCFFPEDPFYWNELLLPGISASLVLLSKILPI